MSEAGLLCKGASRPVPCEPNPTFSRLPGPACSERCFYLELRSHLLLLQQPAAYGLAALGQATTCCFCYIYSRQPAERVRFIARLRLEGSKQASNSTTFAF